jgi:predicted esterase
MKRLYEKSRDGKDQNVLILLHGLGDTAANFIQFGRKLELPQTALAAIEAPFPIPFFEGTSWWPRPFDMDTGAMRPPNTNDIQSIRNQLFQYITREYIDTRGFEADRIFLLGFSQGGSIALDLAIHSPIEFRGK